MGRKGWESSYQALVQCIDETGELPNELSLQPDIAYLAAWVKEQRREYHAGRLNPNRMNSLNQLHVDILKWPRSNTVNMTQSTTTTTPNHGSNNNPNANNGSYRNGGGIPYRRPSDSSQTSPTLLGGRFVPPTSATSTSPSTAQRPPTEIMASSTTGRSPNNGNGTTHTAAATTTPTPTTTTIATSSQPIHSSSASASTSETTKEEGYITHFGVYDLAPTTHVTPIATTLRQFWNQYGTVLDLGITETTPKMVSTTTTLSFEIRLLHTKSAAWILEDVQKSQILNNQSLRSTNILSLPSIVTNPPQKT